MKEVITMITRTITEVKYFLIESPEWIASGHGYSDRIPGKVWYEGPFVSDEDVEAKLAQAMEIFNNPQSRPHDWMEKPKKKIFWKPLDITNNL
jgi:hypothetical protein